MLQAGSTLPTLIAEPEITHSNKPRKKTQLQFRQYFVEYNITAPRLCEHFL
jgi:hypothetical protein